MPRICLRLSEVRAGALPPVCLVCGRTAALYVPKTFSWRPGAAPLLLSVLLLCTCLPVAVVLFIISRSQAQHMTVHTPLCERHRNYWGWRHFWLIVPLLVLVAAVAVLTAMTLSEMIPPGIYYGLFLATVVLIVAWSVLATLLNRSGVRAEEITDDDITLSPVSAAFRDTVGYERTAKKDPAALPWDEYDPYPAGRPAAERK